MTFQSERHRSGDRSLRILAASYMDRTSYMHFGHHICIIEHILMGELGC